VQADDPLAAYPTVLLWVDTDETQVLVSESQSLRDEIAELRAEIASLRRTG
jgi:hypothetical protein